MVPNIIFLLVSIYFVFGQCKLSNDIIETAIKLMKYERVFSENMFDEDKDNILQSGTYTYYTDDRNGYATFIIPNTLIGFSHSVINAYDSKYHLVAINIKNIPEGISSITLPGFTEEERQEHEFIKININNPLPDEGKYQKTSTRAVYQGSVIPFGYAIRNFSYRVPFSTKNMHSIPENMMIKGTEDGELSDWTIQCGKVEEEGTFGGSCGLNWSPWSDKPNPIHESIPILIAGARVFIEGEIVFEMQDDNGIRAGILINGGFESRFGLDISNYLHEEANVNIQEILTSIGIPYLSISLGKILDIGLFIEFGVDLGFQVKYSSNFSGEYLYGLDIKTPDSIFLGSNGGKWSCPDLGDVFNVEIVKPETSFKEVYENVNFEFTGEAYISPFVRGALKLTLLGSKLEMSLDFGSKFGVTLGMNTNFDQCNTFPFIDGNLKIYSKPFFRINSPSIELPFGIVVLEKKEIMYYLGEGWAWTIADGCLTDPQNIVPSSVPKDPIFLLSLNVYKYISNDDYEPFKIVVRVGGSTCLVKGMEFKQSSSDGVIYESSNAYCSLQGISKSDKLSIEMTTNNGIAELFGVSRKINGTFSEIVGTLYPEGKETYKHFSILDDGYTFGFYTMGLLTEIPENFSGEPSEICCHKKGYNLYSTFTTPAGSNYFAGYLFNLENGDKHIWTSGGASVEYITSENPDIITGSKNHPHDSHGFYGYNPGLFTTRKFEVTKIKNSAFSCNMGLILSLGRGNNKYILEEELKSLKGDSLVDYAGTNEGDHPYVDGETYSDRSDLEIFDMEFDCWSGTDPVYLYIHVAWNNWGDDAELIPRDLCRIDAGSYTEIVDDAVITYKIYEIPVVLSVKYIPPPNQKVVSQMFASVGTIVYEKGLTVLIPSNPYPEITDYLILHVDIPMINVEGFLVGLVIEILGPVELLAPNYFLSELSITDETDSSSIISGCYVIYLEPQTYGNMYWIDIPLRYVKTEVFGSDVKPRIKFKDIFLTNENNVICNVDSGWINIPGGSQSEISFGCISPKNGAADLPSANMITIVNDSYYYTGNKTQEECYTIYNLEFTSFIEKYSFVRHQYTLDKQRAEGILPTWIGITARMGDKLMAINNPNGGIVQLTAGTEILEFTGDSLLLCPLTNTSHKMFVDSLLGASTVSVKGSEGEISDAYSISYCPSDINSLEHLLPAGCIFTVKERGVLLLIAEEGLGLKLHNSNGKIVPPDPFAKKQFYEITNENCSFTVDISGSYTVKQVEEGVIIIKMQFSPYNGMDAISFIASSPSGEQYPISKDIWDNETLAIGLGLLAGYGDQIYLDRSGILYVTPEYVKTSGQDANVLKNICFPYIAQSVEIVNVGSGPGFYKNSNGEIVKCLPGNYCVDYNIYPCMDGYYQPSYGSSSCTHCGYHATSSGDRISCIVEDGYYIVSGEYGLENSVIIETCPSGYKCTKGEKIMCGTNEYQPYTAQSTCLMCPAHTKNTDDHLNCLLNDGYYYKYDLVIDICPKGHKCTGGIKSQCEDGEYQPNEGKGYCAICSEHSVSTEDHTSCAVVEGYYLIDGSFGIINTAEIGICPSGHKCINGKRIECGIDEYQINEGQSICVACGNHAWSDSERTTCVVDDGYYVSSGSFSTEDAIIEACPAGYRCNSGIKVQCDTGYYQVLEAQNTCLFCGLFSINTLDHTSCRPIDGYYLISGEYGETNTAVVELCPAGYMCPQGRKTLCNDGYYQTLEGKSSCVSCGDFAVSVENRKTCEIKGGYKYISGIFGETNTVQVGKCSTGHKCESGVEIECESGEYQSLEGQSSCVGCGVYARSSQDKSTCVVTKGYYIAFGGFGEVNDAEIYSCPVGAYCTLGYMRYCPDGNYQPYPGQSTCFDCGSHATNSEDHTSCVVEDGYYVIEGEFDGMGNVVISECPKGYYCQSGVVDICSDGKKPGNDGVMVDSGATECVEVDDNSINPLVWIIPIVIIVVVAVVVTIVLVVLRKRKKRSEEFGKLIGNEEK